MRIARPDRRIRALERAVLDRLIPTASAFGARVAAVTGSDEADCRSAAVEGLYYAWETYDPYSGVQWESWATRQVEYCLRDVLRGKNRHKHYRLFMENFRLVSTSELDANEIPVEETIPDSSEPLSESVQSACDLDAALSCLSQPQRTALLMRADGYSRSEIGAVLGLTDPQVTRMYQEARRLAAEALPVPA